MKSAMPNKALLLYRFVLVNVENIAVFRKQAKDKKATAPEQTTETQTDEKRVQRLKRQYVDLVFHFICILVGFECSMVFTNWVTIDDNQFTNSDVVDSKTLWVRFAGTLVGMLYVIVTCVNNLLVARRKRYRIRK